jgi:hypothetical protein
MRLIYVDFSQILPQETVFMAESIYVKAAGAIIANRLGIVQNAEGEKGAVFESSGC